MLISAREHEAILSDRTASERFIATMELLIEAIIYQGDKRRLPHPVLLFIWSIVPNITQRFTKVIARGPTPRRTTKAKTRPTKLNPESPAKPERPAKPAKPILEYALSRGFFWLRHALPIVGTNINIAKFYLTNLLDEQEMTDLITTHRGLARLIGPLCHMLGIEPQ